MFCYIIIWYTSEISDKSQKSTFFVLFFQINNDVSAAHWAVWLFCTWCCTKIKPSQPALGKLQDSSSIITWGQFYLELWRLEGFWQAPLTQRPHVAALGEGRPFHHRLHWIMDKFLKDQQWTLLYCKNPNVHNLSSNSSLSRSPFCLCLL